MEKIPIEEKYELELMPITIGGKTLDLYGIANWDVFVDHLERKGEEYVKNFPFWVKIWEASIVLTDHLVRTGLDKIKEILEKKGADVKAIKKFLKERPDFLR